ncbi:MAG: VOC family protein [Planctomycetota bacterium]
MIDGLDHIQIAMPAGREDEARAFYGGLLGLREVAKPAELAKSGGCWFRGGRAEIHVGVQKDFQPSRKAHPGLRVVDFDAVHEKLGGEIDTKIPGVRRLFLKDPFGNRIEIGEYPAWGPCPNLLVRDLEEALPFYREKLGFHVVKRREGPPPGVLLERDGMPLLIETTEADVAQLPRHKQDPFGLDALFLVRDLHALYADFHERGTVEKPLPAAATDCMVQTPEGYLLVFSSAL